MNKVIAELIKIADKLDAEGKLELSDAVDETIQALTKTPKDLLNFEGLN